MQQSLNGYQVKWSRNLRSFKRCSSRRAASSSETSGLALDNLDFVKLSSGKSVRVDELGYRPNVAVVLFNQAGQVFTCRRIGSTEAHMNWQFPQGGIDPGETPAESALRELAEETCITSVEMIAEHPEWLYYDFDAHTKEHLGSYMDAYRGQKQKYFLMRFTGDDNEVSLHVPGHAPEFDAYEWVDITCTPHRVAGFKSHVYQRIADEFGPVIAAHTSRGLQ